MASKIITAVLGCLILAGCAAKPPESPEMKRALTSPANAVECRMVYRKTQADQRQAQSNAMVGISSPAGMLGAAIGSGIAKGMNESKRKRDLAACYSAVGAPPEERLPMDGPNRASEEADMAAFEGTAAAPVQRVPVGNPSRRSSGGGSGFSSF